MPATLDARLDDIKAQAETLVNAAKEEAREFTADEQAKFDDLVAEGRKIRDAQDNHSTAASAIAELAAQPSAADDEPQGSFGERFINSPAWQAFRAQHPDGVPKSAIVQTGSTRVGRVRNALLTDPGLTEPRHVMDVPADIDTYNLLDVITVIDDAPQAIKHFTATFTNAADVVAESTEGSPQTKPESTLTWTEVPLNQAVIAHHIPVTLQALNHNAMMRQYIDRFLVAGVRSRAQTQVATQLAAWSGLTAQAFDTDLRVSLRKAVTKAQVNGAILGSGPISILMSANDLEGLDLELLASVQLAPGQAPQQAGNIWRTNIVPVPSMVDGFAYVGDASQIIWYPSGGIDVSVGTVNAQFIENERTILAETEGVTGVLNGGAIIKTDLTAV